ncbi:alpha-galactosidase [Streptococcus suis]|uniref:alpha-galactosidase n=1 Tax=Streptococcus suis TaxID=1307 RepID=UPI001F05CDA9|nr:alpha-galactosidase [Streptococcus suis]MCH1646698.1 alpha-galactosidase [Streptococcus suis]MDG3281363.1 alpha-galactosidase [Streptococcus suis]
MNVIEIHEIKQIFHLKTREFSYIIQVLKTGDLVHRYFGKKIEKFSDGNKITYLDRSFSPSPITGDRTYSLDVLPLEYSSNGLGDFRTSALDVRNEFGATLDLKYKEYRLYKGKKELRGLPASFGNQEEVESLEIDLYDQLTDITVTLQYSVFEEASYLARSATIQTGKYPCKLEKALSATVDFPHQDFIVHSLTGRYAYEKEWTQTPLTKGQYSIGSIRGASSHSRTPFLALASPDAGEDKGDVYAAHLVYSGNFTAFVETTAMETSRLGLGLESHYFSWQLDKDDRFQTPEVLLSYTDKGFTGMTQNSHHFITKHLIRSSFVNKPRPILINNWEATYFEFTEEKILQLAQVASRAGIELFVLDDGWFGKRNNDESSLGDWKVNLDKLPNGLNGLAERINELGMKFGLWFEPEMISIDSDLYREHPDWAIHTEGRLPIYSREQLVLDLTKQEVCDYIIDSVSSILESANISYVKWDMNRNITSIPEGLANDHRFEFHHRYMLGLYSVLDHLTKRFPDILFESCAGGGGRNDLGIMYYMPQAWASDDTDAIERLSIQEGTSLIYPPSSIGAHVSAVPNHQVGRITPLATRGNVAMMGGAFGYELDLTKLSEKELDEISQQIETYHSIRETIQFGQLYRLKKTTNTWAANYVSQDKNQAVFTFIKILAKPEAPLLHVRLKGLDPDALYECPQLGETFYGDELMNIGLAMPHVQQDYFSVQYIFNKI